jgi:cyclic pyranopterin phosphate synthase
MINQQPISLRISLTNRCNLRCLYCRPPGQVLPKIKRVELSAKAWTERIRYIADAIPVSKIRFTGGEPLLYGEIVEVVAGCATLGYPELALTTNGYRLDALAKPLAEAGLSRVNVSLDSLDPDVFHRMTAGRLNEVLAGIQAAKEAGLKVKLNTVVQRGYNFQEVGDLLGFAAREGVEIRYLEMMPIGPAAKEFDNLYVSGTEIHEQVSTVADLEPLDYILGETSRDHRAVLKDGTETVCGLILPTSKPFCDGCRRLRLDSGGKLYGCLAQPDTFPLLKSFSSAMEGNINPLRDQITDALAIKTRTQKFTEQAAMVEIGG